MFNTIQRKTLAFITLIPRILKHILPKIKQKICIKVIQYTSFFLSIEILVLALYVICTKKTQNSCRFVIDIIVIKLTTDEVIQKWVSVCCCCPAVPYWCCPLSAVSCWFSVPTTPSSSSVIGRS